MQTTKSFIWSAAILCMLLVSADLLMAQGGRGRGFRYRGGRGPGGAQGQSAGNQFSQDHDVFHFLLQNHGKIKRRVKNIDNGVETLTESKDPEIAAKIQEHVAAMYKRVEERNPIHMRDPLFAAVFRNTDKIEMEFENTKNGIRVVETSEDPYVAKLIQAHAEVVNLFVKNGHLEARMNHAVPEGAPATAAVPAGPGCGQCARAGAGCAVGKKCPGRGAAGTGNDVAVPPRPRKRKMSGGRPAGAKDACPYGGVCPHAGANRACDKGQCPAAQD
jgi:hypothetical protein